MGVGVGGMSGTNEVKGKPKTQPFIYITVHTVKTKDSGPTLGIPW